MKLAELTDKKIAVWGYGLEGKATASYLSRHALKFTVLCPENEKDCDDLVFVHSDVDRTLLNQFDVVIKSPGISPYQKAVKASSAQFISSSALWFDNEKKCDVIAITGTKGKSTTSAMLAHVLRELGYKVVLAGNFGKPLIECTGKYDYVILETSSYQAKDGSIKADLAVMINLYVEHLNWHITEQQYHRDKFNLIKQSKRAIVNHADNNINTMLKDSPHGSITYFNHSNGFYLLNQVLMYQDRALVSHHGWQLKGDHNLLNAAAVCEVIATLGLSVMAAVNHVKSFQPLPHRFEKVAVINGVEYINDSIATNPFAVNVALKTLDCANTLLLLGGFDRIVDWQWFVDAMQLNPPKAVLCNGQNGFKLHKLLKKNKINSKIYYFADLKSAVIEAILQAKTGDIVLLSPGSPSFDAFDNYQHRGVKFTQWVKLNTK